MNLLNPLQNIRIVCLALTTGLAACSTPFLGSDGKVTSVPSARSASVSYPDIAVPSQTFLDQKASVVIGEGVNWTGHLLATSDLTPTEASNYILQQMQAKGWKLLSSIHADKSRYFFSNQHKVMLVEIAEKGIFSTSSELTYVSSFLDKDAARAYGSSPLGSPSR